MKKFLLFTFLSIIATTAMCGSHRVKATKYYAGHNCGTVTADGSKINNSRVHVMTDRWVALSPDMFKKGYRMKDTIIVTGAAYPILNGEWVIKDKMAKRMTNRIDFLMTPGNSKAFESPCMVTITKKTKSNGRPRKTISHNRRNNYYAWGDYKQFLYPFNESNDLWSDCFSCWYLFFCFLWG